MELHFVNLLALTLIQHVNHNNRQACSKRYRQLCHSKQAELIRRFKYEDTFASV